MDLDLGNYERFLDLTLHKDNNITTGKIYQVGCCCLASSSSPVLGLSHDRETAEQRQIRYAVIMQAVMEKLQPMGTCRRWRGRLSEALLT